MPQIGWINPASDTYQARRWAQRRLLPQSPGVNGTGTGNPTPDPGTSTENVRVNPDVANVAFVTTTVPQPYGGSPVVLYSSSLVRPDPVIPNVAWLTVTETGARIT